MPKLTEIDEAVQAWLAGHHIQMKDVRSYQANGTVKDMTELTITFSVAGVAEMPAAAVPEPVGLIDFTRQPRISEGEAVRQWTAPNEQWNAERGTTPEAPTETIPAVDPNRWATDYGYQAPGRNPGGQ